MIYISGIHALNLDCALETCGDWHFSSLRWDDSILRDSENTTFGDWGIEPERLLPGGSGPYPVANHIRALLDLIEEGDFATAGGTREDYLCNETYTPVVFEMVSRLSESDNWDEVDYFMRSEYGDDWIAWRDRMPMGVSQGDAYSAGDG